MVRLQRFLNLLFVFVLFLVLLASYVYQYSKAQQPCFLCILQRLGMIGVAAALLMNCRFGIKVQHYGLAILSALIGRLFALRQIAMHLCPEFPAFGQGVFGFDLYVWAFFVFSCSIFACAVLLILYGFTKHKDFPPVWGIPEKLAFWAIGLITASNLITTFLECGLTSCHK
ncbi:MAG: disulfide bond formation protein B [Parachlamydiales bacterium]|nr:disulfide bond formation protein B [Parachlamydiales bacterium]